MYMDFKKFFNPKNKQTEDYLELDYQTEEKPVDNKLLIEIEKIEDFNDSIRIQEKIRNGSVVLAKIKDLKNKNMDELKRTIAKLRKTCIAIDGDIAGVSDDWIVLTPSTARVHRGEAE